MENELIVAVREEVQKSQNKKEITLPEDYDLGNAMAGAYLHLEKEGFLKDCTPDSVKKALFSMAVMGLDPNLTQCYFKKIRGNQLICQPSYFGDMALAKRLNPDIQDFFYQVVYRDEVFTHDIEFGEIVNVKHVRKYDNYTDDIKLAYCVVKFNTKRAPYYNVMWFEEILKSWEKSSVKLHDESGKLISPTHNNFKKTMCYRTIIRNTCKYLVNSAIKTNNVVLKKAIEDSYIIEATSDTMEEIKTIANSGPVISMDEPAVVDAEFVKDTIDKDDKNKILEWLNEREGNATWVELLQSGIIYDGDYNSVCKKLKSEGKISSTGSVKDDNFKIHLIKKDNKVIDLDLPF